MLPKASSLYHNGLEFSNHFRNSISEVVGSSVSAVSSLRPIKLITPFSTTILEVTLGGRMRKEAFGLGCFVGRVPAAD